MKYKVLVAGLFAALFTVQVNAQVKFEDYFMEKTMRFDFYHAGDANTENYYLKYHSE